MEFLIQIQSPRPFQDTGADPYVIYCNLEGAVDIYS